MVSRIFILAALFVALTGCAAAAIGGGTYAVKAAKRDELRPQAQAGDAEAQYRLGQSWCCMGPGFDTQTATEWLCKAAAQDHALAAYELGRIYDGEVSRTPAPGQKLLRLATAKRSTAHALAFYELAASLGNAAAEAKQRDLANEAGSVERDHAARIAVNVSASCTYDQVFDASPTKEQ